LSNAQREVATGNDLSLAHHKVVGFGGMALRDRIRELVEVRGLTQRQLAAQAGVTPEQVSRWLSGRYVPSTANLRQLASALQVSVDVLLREDDEDPHVAAVASVAKLARTLGVSPDELRAAAATLTREKEEEEGRCMVVLSGARCTLRRHGRLIQHAFQPALLEPA